MKRSLQAAGSAFGAVWIVLGVKSLDTTIGCVCFALGIVIFVGSWISVLRDVKNGSPEKNSIISRFILVIGALLAVIGAMAAQEYRINLLVITGGAIVVVGIVYHLVMVRCPYCGHSLAGYRPLPDQCPECHKTFER